MNNVIVIKLNSILLFLHFYHFLKRIVDKEAIATHIAAITKGANAIKVSSGMTSYINDTINKGINAILAQNKANRQLRLVYI